MGVVGDELDRPADEAAGLVEELDRVLGRLDHPLAFEAEGARAVEQAAELDRLGGEPVRATNGIATVPAAADSPSLSA